MIKDFHLGFWTDIEVSHLGWGVLVPWDIVKCRSYFWILQGLLFYFNYFFRLFKFFIKGFSCFSVTATDFIAYVWYWTVSLHVGCFGILIQSKKHLAFLSISWYHLKLPHFSEIFHGCCLLLLKVADVFIIALI